MTQYILTAALSLLNIGLSVILWRDIRYLSDQIFN